MSVEIIKYTYNERCICLHPIPKQDGKKSLHVIGQCAKSVVSCRAQCLVTISHDDSTITQSSNTRRLHSLLPRYVHSQNVSTALSYCSPSPFSHRVKALLRNGATSGEYTLAIDLPHKQTGSLDYCLTILTYRLN